MQLTILLLTTGRQSCTAHFLVPEYSSNNSSRLSCTVHMLLVGLPTHFSVPDTVEVVEVVVDYPARAVGWFAKTLFGPWYPLTSLPPTSVGHLGHAQAHEQYWPGSDLFRALALDKVITDNSSAKLKKQIASSHDCCLYHLKKILATSDGRREIGWLLSLTEGHGGREGVSTSAPKIYAPQPFTRRTSATCTSPFSPSF